MSKLDKYADLQAMEEERYFFDQCDSDWFMLPLSSKGEWDEYTVSDFNDDDQELIDEFEQAFGKYRTGGGINDISFTNPKNIK